MKTKLIAIILILFFTQSFAQNNKKHPFAVDFGITYHHVNKKNNYFSSDYIAYMGQVTPFPGYYNYSSLAFQSNIVKYYNFLKYFYFGTGLTYYNDNLKKITSIDTINKYYVFPDSLKNEMNFKDANYPLIIKKNTNSIKLRFSLSFQYKRFVLMTTRSFKIIDIEYNNNTYANDINLKYFEYFLFTKTFNFHTGSYGIQYQILKTIPFYGYFMFGDNYLLGVEYRF